MILLDMGDTQGLYVRKLPMYENMSELNKNIKNGCSAMDVDWAQLAIVCAKKDGSVWLQYLMRDEQKLWQNKGAWNNLQVLAADFSTSRALIGSDVDSVIYLLNVESAASTNRQPGDAIATAFRGHEPGGVLCISVDWNSMRALSGGQDKTLRLWNLQTGELVKTLSGIIGYPILGHEDKVLAVDLNWKMQQAVSAAADESLRLWDLQTGKVLRAFEGHGSAVRTIAVDWNKMQLLSGSDDGTMRHWDLNSGETLRVFENHGAHVRAVSARWESGQALSLAGASPVLRYWDLRTGQVLRVFGQDTARSGMEQVHGLMVSPNPVKISNG